VSDTFRDAIATRFDPAVQAMKQQPEHSFTEYSALFDRTMADAVLASDEMQAIRRFCGWFAHRHGTEDDMRAVLRDEAHLPESVIRWVLDDPSPDSPAATEDNP
jgi:hypothetical protein